MCKEGDKKTNIESHLRDMVVRRIKDKGPHFWLSLDASVVVQLERSRANRHGVAHDDAFANASNIILLSVVGCIKQVVGRPLKLEK